MATEVIYTENALENLERAFEFAVARDPRSATTAVNVIRAAIGILAEHPLVGRGIDGPIRELVISYGKSGYLALYRYRPERGEVRVLAIRHQREQDYPF